MEEKAATPEGCKAGSEVRAGSSKVRVTDELRDWLAREVAVWKMARETFDELEAIADRIDGSISETHIELPMDADGVPIRVWDEMEGISTGTRGTVTSIAPRSFFLDYGTVCCNPESFRHVEPDSWERIIGDAVQYGLIAHGTEEDAKTVEHLAERCRRLAGE